MKFIIIGASTAGTTAAQKLREKDPHAQIVIFTDEKYPYYGRPRLLEFLAGQVELDMIYFHNETWYASNRIDLCLGLPVTKLDPENHQVFTGPEAHSYDKLLIACGARPDTPPLEGAHKDGVFTLWSADDVISVKEYARGQKKAAVIGGGLLGIECAKALKDLGLEVTIVEMADRLLPRQLDQEGAELLRGMLEKLGIKVVLGENPESVKGRGMKISKLILASGKEVPAGVVLIAAGARPNKEIAEGAGLVTNRGILVDRHMRASSENVYAAGDVVEFGGSCYGTIPAALEQAKIAASNMIVEDAMVYDGTVLVNTLKVAGVELTTMGTTLPKDESKYEIIQASDPDSGIYKKALIRHNKLIGAIILGSSKNVVPLNAIVAKEIDISSVRDTILEEDANLRDFLAQYEE